MSEEKTKSELGQQQLKNKEVLGSHDDLTIQLGVMLGKTKEDMLKLGMPLEKLPICMRSMISNDTSTFFQPCAITEHKKKRNKQSNSNDYDIKELEESQGLTNSSEELSP